MDDATTRQAPDLALHQLQLRDVRLEVLAGPDQGLTFAVGPSGAVIGSGSGCDMRLKDELVSRRHLLVEPKTESVRIIDTGSRNGTRVAGVRIREVFIEQDTTLMLGATTLAVRVAGAPLQVALSSRTSFGQALGRSSSMRAVFSLLEKAAARDVTALLEGESGTGKDILAASIHEESSRRDGPFVVVDCGSVPPNLIESELFGHERGAFTGAVDTHQGAFEQAHGGTIFLDEIGELPLELQPKLLRVLEARSFRRLGGSSPIEVDVRVVAATNRRLGDAVADGGFRKDLYYRLAVVHIRVPPLVERPDDVPPLAEMFLRRTLGDDNAELPEPLIPILMSYDWPGNVRELRNVIERFATFGSADQALLFGRAASHAPRSAIVDAQALARLPYHDARHRVLETFHREVLPLVVERAGSVPAAAKLLGMPRASIYRILRRIQEEPPE